jgi:hypothetical protein
MAVALPVGSLEMLDILGLLLFAVPLVLAAGWGRGRRDRR